MHGPRSCFALLVLLLAGGAGAKAPEVVARVNGQVLSEPTFTWLVRNARGIPPPPGSPDAAEAPTSADSLLQRWVEEALLAEEAARTPALSLSPVDRLLLERRRVGFARGLLGSDALEREIERCRVSRADYSPEEVRALLSPPARPRPGTPSTGPDAYDREAARAKVLLTYRLPGRAPGRVTLEDVYLHSRRLNTMIVDEQVRAGNRRAIDALAEELLALQVVEWRASQGDDVARTLQELARIDLNQFLTHKLRAAWGLRELHSPNTAFEQVRREVSDAEIAGWYARHPDKLRRPREIHARHLRVADLPGAHALLEKLRQGADFTGATALPVIDCREPARLSDFERTLAGLPPATGEGAYAPPIPTPEGVEVVRLDKVVYDTAPLADARWFISFQIAEERVRTRFEALRQRLRARAKIELNPRFITPPVRGG